MDKKSVSGQNPLYLLAVRAIGRLDRHLRDCLGVAEYTDHPDCIFRFHLTESPEGVSLSDGTQVHKGDRIIDLHIWNEHVPLIGARGATVAFIARFGQCVELSLAELARYLKARKDLDEIRAIRANIVFGTQQRSNEIARAAARYGFERVVSNTPLSFRQRAHLFGENILISMLVLARNPQTLRLHSLWRGRTLTYLSRKELHLRYGDGATRKCNVGSSGSCDRTSP